MKYIYRTNAGAMDDNLVSFTALGILEFLSKRIVGVQFTDKEILAKTPPHESKDSVLDALHQLKLQGYIRELAGGDE